MPKIIIIECDWIFLSLIGNRIYNNPITYNFHFILHKMSLPHMCGIHSLKVNWPFLHDDGWQNKFLFPSYISFVFWESLIWLWLVVVNMRLKWPFVKTEVNFATGEESTMTFCLHRLGFESLSGSFYFLIWCQLFYASLMTFACYTLSFSEQPCW